MTLELITQHWEEFSLWLFVIVCTTYLGLLTIDVVPEAPNIATSTAVATSTETIPEVEDTIPTTLELPRSISFDTRDTTVSILNPENTDLESLNTALLSGAVRYPGSALLNERGTMIIFGHSSHLAIVHNQNYRAFNDIEDMEWGNLIHIHSDTHTYIYRVDRTYQEKASEGAISLYTNRAQLVLVTCNNFGAKEDRYIVEASLLDVIAN